MNQVKIDGEVQGEDLNQDIFWDKFIEFVESNNWTFCGYTYDMQKKEDANEI